MKIATVNPMPAALPVANVDFVVEPSGFSPMFIRAAKKQW